MRDELGISPVDHLGEPPLRRPDEAVGIVDADHPSVLGAIQSPEVVLAIWRRRLNPVLSEGFAAMSFGRLPTARLEGRPNRIGVRLRALLEAAAGPQGWLDILVGDIEMLVSRFAEVMAADRIRIRLEPVDRDMCRYFHRDNVEARLITTYSGATTQFLAPEDCDASALGKGDNDRIVRSWEKVRSMPEDGVGLFKGTLYPRGAAGCVHRSPPVPEKRGRRLLFCVDRVAEVA